MRGKKERRGREQEKRNAAARHVLALRASLSGPVLSAGERVPEAFASVGRNKKKLRKKSVGA